MTENEAKECIEELKQYNQNGELKTPVNNDVSMLWDGAFGMVIDLFKEIQQYRAIGTIEEFKALKRLAILTIKYTKHPEGMFQMGASVVVKGRRYPFVFESNMR